MKLSVIIPTYNEEEHLEEFLNSFLNQTNKRFEIIVVDDHSTDNTLKILNGFRKNFNLKIVFSNKKNVSYARNLGARRATGDVIAHLDCDCHVNKNFVNGIIESFTKNDVEALRIREDLVMDHIIEKIDYLRTFYKWKGYIQGMRVFKKGYFFDDDLECFGDDFPLKNRIKNEDVILCSSSIIYSHRFHSWHDVVKSWKRYPSGFVYYRKYENVLKGFVPLFFFLTSPAIMINRLFKFRDPMAFLIPLYDFVRSFSYFYGMITHPKWIIGKQ